MSSNGRKFLSSGPLSFPVRISLKGINKFLPFKPVFSFIDLVQASQVSYVKGSSGIQSIADIINYNGKIVWDTSRPNGTPRKLLNVNKINSLGWKPKMNLKHGLQKTFQWYKENHKTIL